MNQNIDLCRIRQITNTHVVRWHSVACRAKMQGSSTDGGGGGEGSYQEKNTKTRQVVLWPFVFFSGIHQKRKFMFERLFVFGYN